LIACLMLLNSSVFVVMVSIVSSYTFRRNPCGIFFCIFIFYKV
jgi:hypothetical protein